ncbi:MAG: hypothetical protein ABI459_01310 [Deltaproteobacteria bacterium]
MKTLLSATLAIMIAAPAVAGSLAPIPVEPELIVSEQPAASSVSPLLVIGLLVVIGAVVSQQND